MSCIVIKLMLFYMYEICFKVLLVNSIAYNGERGIELIKEKARELILSKGQLISSMPSSQLNQWMLNSQHCISLLLQTKVCPLR